MAAAAAPGCLTLALLMAMISALQECLTQRCTSARVNIQVSATHSSPAMTLFSDGTCSRVLFARSARWRNSGERCSTVLEIGSQRGAENSD